MRASGKLSIWLAWAVATGLSGFFEVHRFLAVSDTEAGPLGWLANWDPETTVPFLVLLALPLLVFASGSERLPKAGALDSRDRVSIPGAVIVFCVSFAASAFIGWQPVEVPQSGYGARMVAFSDLPPAYHDEYSYLLQAETFAAGRLSWAAVPVRPDLFHQYHVLNERRTASRYFPLTGAWTALFLSGDRPIVGHWLAGAIAVVFFYMSACEFLRPRTAMVAGLLIAVSPGIAVFSNLLLAHHPTMLALSIFLWSIIRSLKTGRASWTLVSGLSLMAAMLGRPMTAAGFGLPWGIVFGLRLLRDPLWKPRRLRLFAAMILPLIAGFTVLGVMNREITGHWTKSAYQEYTDTYTPRHTYGFNNGERGDAKQSEKVLKAYDQWAVNLTWTVALKNVWQRCLASAQWTLGIIPLVFALCLVVIRALLSPDADSSDRSILWLVIASVLTLHIVHVPYWFDGIMHWHYVFETAPLLLILTAAGLATGADSMAAWVSPRLGRCWLGALVFAALLPGWMTAESFWGYSKISTSTSELAWSRRQFAMFKDTTTSELIARPALILVDETGSDPQLSYIINDPQYDDEVLVARLPDRDGLSELRTAFPDRHVYRFDPSTFEFTELK